MGWRWCSATARAGCAPSCSWRAAGVSISWTPCSPSTCPSSGQWTTTIRSCSGNTGKTFPSSCPESCSPPRMAGKLSQGGKVTSSCVINCQSLVSQLGMLTHANPRMLLVEAGCCFKGSLRFWILLGQSENSFCFPLIFCGQKGLGLYFTFLLLLPVHRQQMKDSPLKWLVKTLRFLIHFFPARYVVFFSNRGSQVF